MLPLSFENLLLTLKEFLVVWIYQVLYHNKVYDKNVFTKIKSFDVIVYKSRQPHLEEYIKGLVVDILEILLDKDSSGQLCNFVILIYDTRKNELEKKYILNFSDLVDFSELPIDKTFLTTEEPGSETLIDSSDVSWAEVYSQLRALTFEHVNELRRQDQIHASSSDNDLFFRPVIELNSSVNLDFRKESSWILHSEKILQPPVGPSLEYVPLGELSLGVVNFGLHNEYVQ